MESISCFFFVGGAHGVMETGINCMWGDQIVEAVQISMRILFLYTEGD